MSTDELPPIPEAVVKMSPAAMPAGFTRSQDCPCPSCGSMLTYRTGHGETRCGRCGARLDNKEVPATGQSTS